MFWDIGAGCFLQVTAQETLQADVDAFIQAGIAPATERAYRAAGRATGRANAAFDAKPVILGLSGKVAEGRIAPLRAASGTTGKRAIAAIDCDRELRFTAQR
jgi:hypothetical protein